MRPSKVLNLWQLSAVFGGLGGLASAASIAYLTFAPAWLLPRMGNGLVDPYGSVLVAGVVLLLGAVVAIGFSLARTSRHKVGEALAFMLAFLAGYLIAGVALGIVSGGYA